MIKPIMFEDYDKISDDILYLGSKLYLRMNVCLSNKYEKDGLYYRTNFHKEFRYDSKYSDSKLITVRRSFDYFLSLEKTDLRVSVDIRPQDIILIRMKLQEVSAWFKDDTFAVKNNKLFVYKKRAPVIIDGLIYGKFLQFDPVAIVWENSGSQTPGVRISLGDLSVFADISIDRFYGLLYTLESINMYESAQLLLNYIQRPEYGTNVTEFEENKYLVEQSERDMKGVNRQIPTNKKRSFFDKMKDM